MNRTDDNIWTIITDSDNSPSTSSSSFTESSLLVLKEDLLNSYLQQIVKYTPLHPHPYHHHHRHYHDESSATKTTHCSPSSPVPCSSKSLSAYTGKIIKKKKIKKRSICKVFPHTIDRLPASVKFKEVTDLLGVAFQVFTPSIRREIFKNDFLSDMGREELWELKKSTMRDSMFFVNKFAQIIPGFSNQHPDTKDRVVLTGTFPVMTCVFATTFDPVTRNFKWHSFSPGDIQILIEQFAILKPLFIYFMNLAKKMKLFNLDTVELSCLCSIFLHDMSDNLPYKELLFKVLEWYERDAYPNDRKRFQQVITFLRYLLDIHRVHSNVVYKFHVEPEFANLPRFIVRDRIMNDNNCNATIFVLNNNDNNDAEGHQDDTVDGNVDGNAENSNNADNNNNDNNNDDGVDNNNYNIDYNNNNDINDNDS